MKVLEVIPDLRTGGAEQVVLSYMIELKDSQEFELSTLVLAPKGKRLYECIIDEKKLRFDFLNQDISDSSFIGRARQIAQIRDYIKKNKPDVIHIHLSILWMICLATIKTPTKYKFHTLHSDPRKTSYGKNRFIDRWCYRVFNVRPICLNKQMKKYADDLFKRNDTLVLPNGINLEKYKNGNRYMVRRELGINEDEFVVGHVGRFFEVKNHKKIIGVFSEILKVRSNSKLVLVGEGQEQQKIENLCKEHAIYEKVIFTGTRSDIPSIMQAFDAFIFPSFYEGLGIVLIEAQAADLHCVISETIPKEAIVSNKVKRELLVADDSLWARELLDIDRTYCEAFFDIKNYDLNHVISKLKKYYRGEF